MTRKSPVLLSPALLLLILLAGILMTISTSAMAGHRAEHGGHNNEAYRGNGSHHGRQYNKHAGKHYGRHHGKQHYRHGYGHQYGRDVYYSGHYRPRGYYPPYAELHLGYRTRNSFIEFRYNPYR